MKRRFILAITTIFLILNCVVVFAEETEEYQYEIRDGKAVLTSYLGSETVVEIPAEIEGYSVIGLEKTFKGNREIEKVIIPDGIEFLGADTFSYCKSLKNVTLPDSIEKMGMECFSHSGLESVRIPASMEEIGLMNFYYCENLESVDFGDSKIKKICNGAFSFCFSLKSIDLPDSLEEIIGSPFYYCQSLEELTIPKSIKKIHIEEHPIVSGNNLKRIINLSNIQYHKDLFYSNSNDKYSWFTTEEGYELAEYLPANSTIYYREKDSSKKYLEKYLSRFDENSISMKDANTEEEILKLVLNKKPDPDFDSINCEIEINSFKAAVEGDQRNINGRKGYAYLRIKVTNSAIQHDEAYGNVSIDILPIPYKEGETTDNDSNKTSTKEYAERYKEVLKNLEHSGISMKIGNTPEELKKYIESLAPDNKNENISYSVEIFEKDGPILFKKAVAGTRNNKNGTNGSCPVKITVKNTLHFEETVEIREVIPILATQYEGSSNNNSSSKPDYDDDDDDSEDDESYIEIVDTSYENKNSLSDIESLLVSNTATVFFGNISQVKTVEKAENGVFIISKSNEIIFVKSDGTLAKNEWQKSGSDWYYFDADYKAAKGWKFLGNKWYYLDDTTSKMVIGWLKSPVSGKWYYLDSKNGNMKTGWQQISNKWYYMDSTGAMMANTTTPDGYRVNEKGEWVK